MEVMFIRHKMDHTKDTLEELWSNRLIAVHFGDIPSTDSERYPEKVRRNARIAFKRLDECCEKGAIVGADFSALHRKMLVGEIERGSKVEPCEFGEGKLGKTKFIYKVVQLKNVREVSYGDYPLLLAIQPRRGTIVRWSRAKKYLSAILGRGKIPWSVDSLDPCQLEIMCYEYLRSGKAPANMKVDFLLMPIGRTLRDVDIVGVTTKGKKLFAQVTHGSSEKSEILHKINALIEYKSPRNMLVFFGPKKLEPEIEKQPIEYVPTEKVFELLTSNKSSSTYEMISSMLNW